jgi:Protein of unknown function (DUF3126)
MIPRLPFCPKSLLLAIMAFVGDRAQNRDEPEPSCEASLTLAGRLYIAIVDVPEAACDNNLSRHRREPLKPEEIRKLDAFFKRTFQNPRLEVKARPRKDDSAEVYVGDEFLGIVFKDEDEGDYNFSMAILDIDL